MVTKGGWLGVGGKGEGGSWPPVECCILIHHQVMYRKCAPVGVGYGRREGEGGVDQTWCAVGCWLDGGAGHCRGEAPAVNLTHYYYPQSCIVLQSLNCSTLPKTKLHWLVLGFCPYLRIFQSHVANQQRKMQIQFKPTFSSFQAFPAKDNAHSSPSRG